MAISCKDGILSGTLVLNTVLDPVTKSNPNGRAIKISNFKLRVDGISIDELEKKAIAQIGIEVRAKVRDWDASSVRALCNTVKDWKDWYTGPRGTSVENMSTGAIVSKVSKGKSKEDIEKIIAQLQASIQ